MTPPLQPSHGPTRASILEYGLDLMARRAAAIQAEIHDLKVRLNELESLLARSTARDVESGNSA